MNTIINRCRLIAVIVLCAYSLCAESGEVRDSSDQNGGVVLSCQNVSELEPTFTKPADNPTEQTVRGVLVVIKGLIAISDFITGQSFFCRLISLLPSLALHNIPANKPAIKPTPTLPRPTPTQSFGHQPEYSPPAIPAFQKKKTKKKNSAWKTTPEITMQPILPSLTTEPHISLLIGDFISAAGMLMGTYSDASDSDPDSESEMDLEPHPPVNIHILHTPTADGGTHFFLAEPNPGSITELTELTNEMLGSATLHEHLAESLFLSSADHISTQPSKEAVAEEILQAQLAIILDLVDWNHRNILRNLVEVLLANHHHGTERGEDPNLKRIRKDLRRVRAAMAEERSNYLIKRYIVVNEDEDGSLIISLRMPGISNSNQGIRVESFPDWQTWLAASLEMIEAGQLLDALMKGDPVVTPPPSDPPPPPPEVARPPKPVRTDGNGGSNEPNGDKPNQDQTPPNSNDKKDGKEDKDKDEDDPDEDEVHEKPPHLRGGNDLHHRDSTYQLASEITRAVYDRGARYELMMEQLRTLSNLGRLREAINKLQEEIKKDYGFALNPSSNAATVGLPEYVIENFRRAFEQMEVGQSEMSSLEGAALWLVERNLLDFLINRGRHNLITHVLAEALTESEINGLIKALRSADNTLPTTKEYNPPKKSNSFSLGRHGSTKRDQTTRRQAKIEPAEYPHDMEDELTTMTGTVSSKRSVKAKPHANSPERDDTSKPESNGATATPEGQEKTVTIHYGLRQDGRMYSGENMDPDLPKPPPANVDEAEAAKKKAEEEKERTLATLRDQVPFYILDSSAIKTLTMTNMLSSREQQLGQIAADIRRSHTVLEVVTSDGQTHQIYDSKKMERNLKASARKRTPKLEERGQETRRSIRDRLRPRSRSTSSPSPAPTTSIDAEVRFEFDLAFRDALRLHLTGDPTYHFFIAYASTQSLGNDLALITHSNDAMLLYTNEDMTNSLTVTRPVASATPTFQTQMTLSKAIPASAPKATGGIEGRKIDIKGGLWITGEMQYDTQTGWHTTEYTWIYDIQRTVDSREATTTEVAKKTRTGSDSDTKLLTLAEFLTDGTQEQNLPGGHTALVTNSMDSGHQASFSAGTEGTDVIEETDTATESKPLNPVWQKLEREARTSYPSPRSSVVETHLQPVSANLERERRRSLYTDSVNNHAPIMRSFSDSASNIQDTPLSPSGLQRASYVDDLRDKTESPEPVEDVVDTDPLPEKLEPLSMEEELNEKLPLSRPHSQVDQP